MLSGKWNLCFSDVVAVFSATSRCQEAKKSFILMKLRAETEGRPFSSRVPVQSAFNDGAGKTIKTPEPGLNMVFPCSVPLEPCFRTGKTSPEFGFAEFWSFVPLQRKTHFL